MNTVTITVDLDRLAKYADPAETVAEFFQRVGSDARTGSTVVWTKNGANVGSVVK